MTMRSGSVLLYVVIIQATAIVAASVPSYVTDYAPLVYIDINDPYLPSDIGSQVTNTNPELNFTQITSAPATLSLDNLSNLNSAGSCDVEAFDNCAVYLTSRMNVSTNPPWLYGVLPNPSTGETVGAKSCAIVTYDHGNGALDAFYFYFYAFNLGETISGLVLGNHVGDWEHTMLRFIAGKPDTMWYSAHDGGFTYTYEAVSKNNSRPLVYASLGGHANYPTPGLQQRNFGTITLNDTTSAGPLWDPAANAYYYTFAPNTSSPYGGTFTPVANPKDASGSLPPVDWLYFLGRWGDKRYPDSNPIQVDAAGIAYAYEDGPTGPLDKQLQRNGTCPKDPCTTTSTLPIPSGTTAPAQTVSRTSASGTTSSSTSAGTASSTPTSSSASPRSQHIGVVSILVFWLGMSHLL